jgi:tRNA-splicing ligase RtcB
MSRSEAFKAIASGEFHRQMKHVWFDHRLTRKLRDEAPSAYKDIHAVMRAQRELTRIVRKLRPVLSYKGA